MNLPANHTLLSVIVPAYDEAGRLEQTLPRIQEALGACHDSTFSWELIVCDNNSSDGTSEVARRHGATVVFEPINQIARARNTGAAAAQGTWLLFIDADTYPPPALVDEVLDLIRGGGHVGCGTTVVAEDGPLWSKLRLERMNPLYRLFNWCGGAFIACRRDAFEEISGFSTDLYALEEVDFVVRLKRHGRMGGKKFTVLHRHPVVTSARKGDFTLRSVATLVVSTVMSVILLLLHTVLPRRWRIRGGRCVLGYWYDARE